MTLCLRSTGNQVEGRFSSFLVDIGQTRETESPRLRSDPVRRGEVSREPSDGLRRESTLGSEAVRLESGLQVWQNVSLEPGT